MKMPRCLGFTKTGKNCRSRIKEGFFCNTHEPYNYDKDNDHNYCLYFVC